MRSVFTHSRSRMTGADQRRQQTGDAMAEPTTPPLLNTPTNLLISRSHGRTLGGVLSVPVVLACAVMTSSPAWAAPLGFPAFPHAPSFAMVRPFTHPHPQPNPGYLGVSILDLDSAQAKQLRLKDSKGVLIVTIDRDAPAASAGLRAHDVILEMDGHRVETAEQLRKRLRETTAGATIALQIVRDGAQQRITVQLGDEAEIAERAWTQHVETQTGAVAGSPPGGDQTVATSQPQQAAAQVPFSAPQGRGGPGSSFLGVFSISSLYTGLALDPLSTQLAEYFGVHDGAGLLVRTVNENSPAWVAGLRAGDVIFRVNNQAVVSHADWMKQLRASRGHAMQLGVMRNRHEQAMTLTAGAGTK